MIKFFIVLLLACSARALDMEQVLMEEPGRTNRSAAAWIASKAPLVSDAATLAYLRALVATSSYATGISYAPGILSDNTERFSPNWSYIFRNGGGFSVDTIEVRNEVNILPPKFSAGSLEARFLMVTNRGDYGSLVISNATLRGSVYSVEDIRSSVSVASEVSTDSLAVEMLDSPTGKITISSPAVYFARDPVFLEASDIYSGTNYPPSSSFYSLGNFNLGDYSAGLMWLKYNVLGAFTVSNVERIGANAFEHISYSVGGDKREPATWACVPVLVTHYDAHDPAFFEGFWNYSQTNLVAAYGAWALAVTNLYSVHHIPGLILAYDNPGDQLIDGPSLEALKVAESHMINLTTEARRNPAAFLFDPDEVESVFLAFKDATEAVLDYLLDANAGTVSIASPPYTAMPIDYTRYQQMAVESNSLYRVTMQLQLGDGVSMSDVPARYWLVCDGVRLLMHTVSSAGETGSAFVLLHSPQGASGFFYLDLSDYAEKNSADVLNATSYYVKVELLRGFSTCHQ